MIALDDCGKSEAESHEAGNGDLGQFNFDDALAEDLGKTIVKYSKVI